MMAPTKRKRASPLHSLPTLLEGKSFYDKNGVIVVRKCVRSTTVKELMNLLQSKAALRDKRASGRKTLCIDPSSEEANLLYNDKRLQKVFTALHSFDLRPSEFPIEYRIYPSASPGMPWHQDLPMTSPNQIEIVLTLYNDNTGGKFVMKDTNNRKHEVFTKSADIAFVRPDSALHKITKLTKHGDRAIIKFIAVPPRAQRLPAFATEIEHCPTAQSPSFAKRKRDDAESDNPCEDNVNKFGKGYFRTESRCDGRNDVVTGGDIEENKGICAGKQCADFDSYVTSVRAMAENGYDRDTDTHVVIDPFNRERISLTALAAARPSNGMPVAEVIAPLSKDKKLDENYQFEEEGRENPNQAFVDGDENVYDSDAEQPIEQHRVAPLIESIRNVLTRAKIESFDFNEGIAPMTDLDLYYNQITNAAGVTAELTSLSDGINSEDITSDLARQLGFAEVAFRVHGRHADGTVRRSKLLFVRIPYMNDISMSRVVLLYNKDVKRSSTFTVRADDNHYVAVQAHRPQLSNVTARANMFEGKVMIKQPVADGMRSNDGKEIWFSGVNRGNYALSLFTLDYSGHDLDQYRPRVIVQDFSEEYRAQLQSHLRSVRQKVRSDFRQLAGRLANTNEENWVAKRLYLEFAVDLEPVQNAAIDTILSIPYNTQLLSHVRLPEEVPSDKKDMYVPSEIFTDFPVYATRTPTQAKRCRRPKMCMAGELAMLPPDSSDLPLMQYAEISPREVLAMSAAQIDKYNGYMITEKVDGWYVTWDGNDLRTKSGHILPAPQSFKAKLPKIIFRQDDMIHVGDILSGELVLFHDELTYQATDVASLRRKDGPWDHAQIAFFDIINISDTYKWRYKRLLYYEAQHRNRQKLCGDREHQSIQSKDDCTAGTSRYVWYKNRHVPAASYVIKAHVIDKQNNLRQIVKTMQTSAPEGFEGYVVTDPNSLYENKRVGRMTRVKIKVRRDSEAKVVGYNPRSLKVVTTFPNAPPRPFHLGIGLTNEQKKNLKKHFPLHSLVKYSYRSLTKNYKPKEARILGRRHAQDLASARKRKPKPKSRVVTKKRTEHDGRQQLLNHLANRVYVRLKPGIAGVGVFAVRDIPANTNPFATVSQPCRTQKLVKVPKAAVARLDSEVQRIVHDFYGSDESQSYISIPSEGPNDNDISYYMNESKHNWNVRPVTHKDCELVVFETARVIKKGEELLTNYDHQTHAQPAAVLNEIDSVTGYARR